MSCTLSTQIDLQTKLLSGNWYVLVQNYSRLSKADNSMLRWVCSVELSDRYSVNELREKLKLRSVEEHMKSCCLTHFSSMLHFYTPWKRRKTFKAFIKLRGTTKKCEHKIYVNFFSSSWIVKERLKDRYLYHVD